MTQIRGNQPSFNPALEKAIVQDVKAIADAHGGGAKAVENALHDVLNALDVKGGARSQLKLGALRDLKKSYRVLDAAFAHRPAPKPVAPPTRAS